VRDDRTYAGRAGAASISGSNRARIGSALRAYRDAAAAGTIGTMIEIRFPPRDGSRPDPGRSFGWRLVTTFFGLGFLGAGVLVIVWPAVLAFAVGGLLGAVGLFLLATALAARGR
jgi:hypothetical protein